MDEGSKTMQKLLRRRWKRAVTRLHEPIEAERSYPNYVEEGESILLIISEGPEGYAQTEGRALDNIIQANNGKPLGEKPLIEWLEKRNKTNELENFTSQGIIVDRIEIAAK